MIKQYFAENAQQTHKRFEKKRTLKCYDMFH